MKIENQVCSIKQSIKLKALNVKQDSHFFWVDRKEKSKLVYAKSVEFLNSLPIYSAYSVSELSQMVKGGTYESERLWNRMLSRINGGNSCVSFYNASFLAEFLIEILEAKYLSVEACNERLIA